MSAGTVLLIAIPVLVVLAIVSVATTGRRRDRDLVAGLTREAVRADRSPVDVIPDVDLEAEVKQRYATAAQPEDETLAEPAPPPPRAAVEVGITRRQLFNRGIVATSVLGLVSFGGGVLAFLWGPSRTGGFGGKIAAGRLDEILADIAKNRAPIYVPEARGYLTPYPAGALATAKTVYDPSLHSGLDAGLFALFQTCPHLGCRVPWCQTSQWFECPCHGSKYNRVGEKRGGPAPRGMDRFPIEFDGDRVVINTGLRVVGPEIGTNTTGQTPEGPHCV